MSSGQGAGASSSNRSESQPPSYTPHETAESGPSIDDPDQAYSYNVNAHEGSPNDPPPAYTERPGQITEENEHVGTNAVVADDGRVNIRINQKTRRLSQLLAPQIQRQVTSVAEERAPPPPYVPESLGGAPGQTPPPPLNLVIQVVGSRGDVQPFIALGKVLKEMYGHRVRLATHPVFKDFVTENGLEFFSIGGDPAELMAFMVKNPGLMPGFDTLRSGDVGKRRKGIAEILRGTWRSCIEPGDGLGVDPVNQTVDEWMGVEAHLPDPLKKPFVADAIIANPPAFGHVHCAEKLGIPLHMMFTMPWSPTQQFPHPLANIQASNVDSNITNYMSYTLVDMLTWQGLGDVINKFRKDSLSLDPIGMLWAPGMLARMKIPYTYCWSPALIPKPRDWGQHISIAGFYFLNLASNYTPEPALAQFLAAGEPPVYIGFGSIVVDDPNAMTQMIFEAVKKTGRRALVSKGWGGLGADELGIPEGVFMLGNVPHDWLFKHVAAVVHHGGAGTTAAGISAGRPTVIVPFFGDQPFWGAMTAKAGAGPPPIPYKDLTADKLAGAIEEALKPESLEKAKHLADLISKEQGSQSGAQSFHQMLRYDDFRCMVAPRRPAVWRMKRTQVRLSAKVATILAQEGELDFSELKLYRPREYETDEGPWDPISGGATAIVGTATQMMMGVADFPIETLKLLSIHPDTGKGKNKATVSQDDTTAASARSSDSQERRPTSGAGSRSNSQYIARPDDGQFDSRPQSPGSDIKRKPVANTSGHRISTPTEESPPRGGSSTPQASNDSQRSCPSSQSPTGPATDVRHEAGNITFADRLRAMNAEAALGTGKGVGKIVSAGFKSPMDFSLNVAKGFHNVPKLYGGETRKVDKVTDFQSGVRTAAKEFGMGFYGGITGLVTDPYKGAKKEGALGFVKGVGRGIAGVPVRVMGGVFSVPGYAMKGLYQEVLKNKGANVQNYIIAARISQGNEEAKDTSRAEREDILRTWRALKVTIKKKKNVGEDQMETLTALMKEKRAKRQEKWVKLPSDSQRPEAQPAFSPALPGNGTYEEPQHSSADGILPSSGALGKQLAAEEEAERRELEAAIRASVSETSRGNPDEDEMITQAIRASMQELERPAPSDENEEETLQRALRASVEEAGKHGASEEEQRMLEETLRNSLFDVGGKAKRVHGSDSEWENSDSETASGYDEEYQRIIAESKELAHIHALESGHTTQGAADSNARGGSEDDELQKALEESERAERERMAELQKQRDEEDVVMEYVKKQSLMEEEHRRRLMQGRDTGAEGSGSGGR